MPPIAKKIENRTFKHILNSELWFHDYKPIYEADMVTRVTTKLIFKQERGSKSKKIELHWTLSTYFLYVEK